MPRTESTYDKARKLADKINHTLDPRILASNIANNPSDFSEEQILALFIKYGEQAEKL
jgi:hypothetical protein